MTLVGVPDHPRFGDAVDVFWALKLNQAVKSGQGVSSAELRKDLWLDVSQQISRTATHNGLLGVLTTSSLFYSYERDCVLDGEDTLCIQGFPKAVSMDDELSNHEKQHLAGEAFHLGTVGSVIYAAYLNPWGPWWSGSVRT